jgi:hypothetical protein
MKRNFHSPFIVLFASLTTASPGNAADYSAGFSMKVDASHNDNIRLVETNKTSVRKYDASPTLSFSGATENTKLELTSKFDFNQYDRSEFNSNDQNIGLTLSHQLESGSLGLNASYVHNSTISSELLTSGRVGDKATRSELYSVSPNWSYLINETNFIQWSASYALQNYESDAYTGYKYASTELDWMYLLSEQLKLSIGGSYSDYRADDIEIGVPRIDIPEVHIEGVPFAPLLAGAAGNQGYATQTKSKGIVAGLDYQWSEQSQIKARFGRSQTRTSYSITDPRHLCADPLFLLYSSVLQPYVSPVCMLESSDNPQTSADLNWSWRGERQQLDFDITKTLQPTSNGYAVDAWQLTSGWSYRLSELDKLSVNLSLVRNRAIDEKNSVVNAQIADRNYGLASIRYQRQLNEHWLVKAGFDFSEQKYTETDYQASSRVFSLGVTYQPTQWHWSR